MMVRKRKISIYRSEALRIEKRIHIGLINFFSFIIGKEVRKIETIQVKYLVEISTHKLTYVCSYVLVIYQLRTIEKLTNKQKNKQQLLCKLYSE